MEGDERERFRAGEAGWGPTIGSIIVVVILLIGAIYVFSNRPIRPAISGPLNESEAAENASDQLDFAAEETVFDADNSSDAAVLSGLENIDQTISP